MRPRRIAVLGALAAAAASFVLMYRPWHLRWGATDEEVAVALPGDDLVPRAEFVATRAITIDSPPDAVWPWIVQIGYGRAGFYAYDLLDNLGRPSADRIIEEFQHPRVGDWVAMSGTINDNTAFRVHSFEPDRWMLWSKPASTWAWSLEPLDGGRTRLVSRIRAAYRWTRPTIVTDLLLMELGDFPMSRHQLLAIKRRAETRSPATGG